MNKEQRDEMNQLKEQVKLLEELVKLKESYSNATTKNINLGEKLNKVEDIKLKLEQQGLKVSQYLDDVSETLLKKKEKLHEYEKKELEIEKEREKVNNNIKKTKEETAEMGRKEAEELEKIELREISRLESLGTAKGYEEDILEAKKEVMDYIIDQERIGNKINDQKKKELLLENDKVKSLEKQKRLKQEEERRQNKSSESIKQSLNNINIPGLGRVSDLKNFSELSTSAKLISVAADTFNEAVGKFTQLFTGGMNRIADRANSQFQGISVQSGMSYSTYRNGVGGMNSTLSRYGLQDNIRTSDVQDMMSKLANTGMSQEQLFANAIETVITKNIVPYLELGTDSMQQFNQNVNGDLMKQVRGIARINQEMFEGNQVATKYLQDQLEYLAPMSAVAELDLIQNSEEMMAYYQDLRKQGLSDSQIAKEISKVRRIQDDASGVLKGGSLDEKLTVINGEINGLDFTSDSFGIARELGNVTSMLTSNGPNDGGLTTYLYGNWAGFGGRGQAQYGRLGLDRNGAASRAIEAGSRLSSASDSALLDFSNGKNQTTYQKQEASLENISSQIAMWKVDTGVWFDVLTTAVKGIANILLTYLAGKAVSGIGGKIPNIGGKLSSAGTFLNAGLQQGFAKGSTTALGAGKLGFMNSTAGAVAGGAGILAGGAMAVKGGMDVYNDFQNDNVNAGTAMSAVGAAGGAVGAGALLALGASNPIGWVALATGGIALLGRSMYDAANNFELAGKQVEKEFNDVASRLQEESMQKEESLLEVKESLKSDQDIEEARRKLIETGMLSDKDLQKAQKASKEELEKLTDQYIKSTRELSDEEQEIIENMKSEKAGEANETAKSIKDWFEKDFKNNNTKENNEVAKNLIMNTASQLNAKGSANWTDKEKKFMERYQKNFKNGELKDGYKDLKWILEGGGSWGGISDAVMGNATDIVENTGFVNYANARGAGIKDYNGVDPSLATYIAAIRAAKTQEELDVAISKAKEAGVVYSEWESQIKNNHGLTVPAFRVGTDSIPYDNYPALLHEGEAVLTASTANELRSLVDEYRSAKYDSARIEKAIQDQTTVLVESLNAIYSRIPATGEEQAKEVMPGNLQQNYRKMTLPFN